MDTTQQEAHVTELLSQEDELKKNLEQITQQYLEASKRHIAAWFQTKVEETVKTKADVTARLGSTGELSTLKAQLKILIDKVPSLVDDILDADKCWKHRGELPHPGADKQTGYIYDYNYEATEEGRVFRALEEAEARILGHVGDLLVKYQYEKADGRSSWDRSYDGVPAYKGDYKRQIVELKNLLEQYRKLYGELLKKHVTLLRTQQEIERIKAQNLWDQA